MKMSEVCSVFSDAGMRHVSSVQASGNIIFVSDGDKIKLRALLEKALADHYQMDISLFIKRDDEVESITNSVPFEADPQLHTYAFICESGFEKELLEEFNKIVPSEHEEALVNNDLFYWRVAKGSTLDAGFSKILGRKTMRESFTSRNITTIEKIIEKMKKIN
jgi:Uncharacterized protein conserved in bacteria